MNNRLIKSNDAGGGACTNTVDLYNPFPDGGGLALYQLNGNATDVSGNYDGTATSVTYGAGQFGQAGVFNGSSSKVVLDYSALRGTTLSVSLWFKTTSSSFSAIIDSQAAASSSKGFGLYLLSNGTLELGFSGGSGSNKTQTSLSYNDGLWHNATIVFNLSNSGNNAFLYIDNNLVITLAVTVWTSGDSTYPIALGVAQTNYFFNGSIDQVRIFNRALRPYEVEALYTEEYCTPTIVPSEHFNTVTYTGNGTSQSISTVGFQPDFTWIKARTQSGSNHILTDSLRGADYQLFSNLTNGETYFTTLLTSFDSNGFSVGDYGYVNQNGDDFVAWNFKAGGAAVTNTDGTITSQVSANTEAGFSVVTATMGSNFPQTIGHGLGTAPDVIIAKRRSISSNWVVYHKDVDANPQNYTLFLESTDAKLSTAFPWNNTAPTSSVFTTGEFFSNNETMVAYCFAEVEGFSNFGSYVGTGASGNTVVTGFEPAFVMVKRTDGTGVWVMLDNKRNLTNPKNSSLYANTSAQEDTGSTSGFYPMNFYENGFEPIQNTGDYNASGGSYIYMAFAADPTTIEPSLEDSFNTVVYSGTSGTQSITGVGFQPDLVWAKNRTAAPTAHILSDSVRGIKQLTSSGTDAEGSSTNMITSYDSDGFGVGDAFALCNASGYNFVAWCWKGAEIPAINSNGSIPSVVSANPAAGFSIVSYTGTDVNNTIGHGLGIAPNVIIIKDRTVGRNWRVYHSAIGTAGQNLKLNTTDVASSDAAIFQSTTPTGNVFYVGASGDVNANTDNFIAYCFAEVAGFSKFGSYTGTGAAGNFQDCGFDLLL
jgi:hypothetical protein